MASAVAKMIGLVLNKKELKASIEDFKYKTEDEDLDDFVQDLTDRIYQYCDESVKPQVERHVQNKNASRQFQ